MNDNEKMLLAAGILLGATDKAIDQLGKIVGGLGEYCHPSDVETLQHLEKMRAQAAKLINEVNPDLLTFDGPKEEGKTP